MTKIGTGARFTNTGTGSRFTKSQLRDPKVVDLAQRELVEVLTSGDDNVAMLPWRILMDREQLLDYAEAFVQVTSAINRPDVPRALLGDFAFLVDLGADDQTRFVDAFGEALAESIRTRDSRPVEFLVGVYRNVTSGPQVSSPVFSGDLDEDIKATLADRVPLR